MYGEVAERPIAPVLKTGGVTPPGFESQPHRFSTSFAGSYGTTANTTCSSPVPARATRLTPAESDRVPPTAGEPAAQSRPDRYWERTVDREALFNLARGFAD